MSEPRLILRNALKEEFAWSKFGVMWRKGGGRVGYFFDGRCFSDDDELLGMLEGHQVYSPAGVVLGELLAREQAEDVLFKIDILAEGQLVGQVFGDMMMAAAGLVFFRDELIKSSGS